MKIGIFVDCYYPQINGVVTSIRTLRKGLVEKGHEVYIITPSVKNYKESDDHIIRTKSIAYFKQPEFRLGLISKDGKCYEKVDAIDFDIIHTQTEFSLGSFGKKIAKKHNIPIVHTYHTLFEEYTHHLSKYGQKHLKKFAIFLCKKHVEPVSAAIVPTNKTKNILKSYGIKNQIFVVPTGLDLSIFKKEPDKEIVNKIKKDLKIKESCFKMMFLGRIAKEKNIETILNVLPRLIQKEKNIQLIIAGDGPYKSELEDIVNKNNLSDYVVFTSRIEHDMVSHYYKIPDLFISASKTETQGLTILEAISSSLPVLVYDDTNVDNLVFHKVTGLRFKTEDELLEQILFSMNNKKELEKYTKEIIPYLDNFSSTTFVNKIEDIYKKLIEEHKIKRS